MKRFDLKKSNECVVLSVEPERPGKRGKRERFLIHVTLNDPFTDKHGGNAFLGGFF